MGKAEALASALLVGLLLMWGLMAWGTLADSGPAGTLTPERVDQLLRSAQQDNPPDDPHANQPEHCTNAKDAPKAHKCDCKKDPGVDGSGCEIEDIKCKKYCKKNKCYCFHSNCDS